MINKIKINITGKNPDYFLKELIRRKINIYDLEKINNSINIIISYDDYKKIQDIKTINKIKVIKRYGINKFINDIKKYKIILLMFIIGILINIVLSNIVLKIEVIHPNTNIQKGIIKDLEKLGLKKYHWKISYSKKEYIKEQLLKKENIEWLEIEEQGTKYIVKVEERKKNKKEKQCPTRHIVSKKNAMITKIEAESGEVVKKINDYVSKGEPVISGLIHNKETIVTKRCSKGKIYGEVWYTVKVSVPKTIQQEKLINKYDLGLTIKILNKNIILFNKLSTFEKNEYNIIENRIIPINISLTKFQEKKEYNKVLTKKEIEKKAIKIASKNISKRLNNDEHIISKKVLKKNEFNSKIDIEVFFKVEENITDYQNIEQINIDELNKKE